MIRSNRGPWDKYKMQKLRGGREESEESTSWERGRKGGGEEESREGTSDSASEGGSGQAGRYRRH